MNEIKLKGILKNIKYSHTINGVEYNKADLIVKNQQYDDDVLSLRFKKFSNKYAEDTEIELIGNVRSYSQKVSNSKNKVDIYVFTYFDIPTEDEEDIVNQFNLDGRICKIDDLRITKSGKQSLHFILANNIISNASSQKLNNYIPCQVWGKLALEMSNLKVNDYITITGQLHSRTYKKLLDNGEIEFRVAHEALVLGYEK